MNHNNPKRKQQTAMTALSNPVEVGGDSNGVGFPEVGTGITFGLVKFDTYQQKDYDTDEPKTWSDGKPIMGTIITGIAHKVDGVEIGPRDNKRTPEVGEEITVWVEGSKHFAWRDATKAAQDAGHAFEVGDLVWFACTSTEPPKNPKHNPRKVYEAKVAKPGPEHSELVAKCEAAHRADSAIAVEAPSSDPFAA